VAAEEAGVGAAGLHRHHRGRRAPVDHLELLAGQGGAQPGEAGVALLLQRSPDDGGLLAADRDGDHPDLPGGAGEVGQQRGEVEEGLVVEGGAAELAGGPALSRHHQGERDAIKCFGSLLENFFRYWEE